MKILGLEFSSPQRSVAVLQGGNGAHDARLGEVIEAGAWTGRVLGMIEEALGQVQIEREEIECVAIGIGPGSYTGIRSAISLAQGWQLAFPERALRVLGISSIECLAAEAQAQGLTGRVGVVIDAQRNEFYLAGYELGDQGRREIEPLRLASLAEVKACEREGWLMLGPDLHNLLPGSRVIFPRAATLAQLALGRNDFVSAETLEPIYLRETSFIKAPPSRILPS